MSADPRLKKSQQKSGDLKGESPTHSLTGDQFPLMP